MKSDDKKSRNKDSSGDKVSGKPKRPSRVIDLEAAEVDVGSEEKPSAGPPPPRRNKLSDIKNFATHLAAGLAGGLIGAIGVGLALDSLAVDPPDNSQANAQFEQRLDALDARLAKQAKSIAAASERNATRSEEALKTLAGRIAALERKPAAVAVDLQPLRERLASLEDTLKTLQASGNDARESASGAVRALAGRIAALERKPSAAAVDLQPLRERLASLENTLKTLQASGNDAGERASGAVRALEAHLAALENKIDKLASRPPAPSPKTSSGSGSVALALTFASLRRAIDRGEPFSGALKKLQEIAPAGLEFSSLAKHAGAGIGTDIALLIKLAPALKAARAAAAARSDDDTLLGRLAANARSIVQVRRIGPAAGDSADAVLSRMEAHMKGADLTGVRKQAQSLSGPALESLQPWLTRAKARRAVQVELEQLERSLLAGLQSGEQR